MEFPSKETLSLLYFLLPGQVAAWVFYGLTAHPKREAFERIVQALIFTIIVQACVFLVKFALLFVGRHFIRLGNWTEESSLVWSVVIAFIIGVAFSALANSSLIHKILRYFGVTKRTSFPSEWYSAFHRFQKFSVLHLRDGRRLRGWPEEWPDQCERGHFLMQFPEWVLDNGTRVPLFQTSRMLIAAADVERVEIEFDQAEILVTPQAIESQKLLIGLHESKECDNGKESSAKGTDAPVVERTSSKTGDSGK